MNRVVRFAWFGVGLIVAVIAFFGMRTVIAPDGYELIATFDDVGDLVSRHSVQIADVRIGEVSGIDLTDDFRAEIHLRIQPDVKVPEGTEALLRTTSLLGEKFIELRPPSTDSMQRGPFMADGDRIGKTSEAAEFENVADTLIETLGAVEASDIATLIDVGASGFGGQRDALRALVTDLSTVSDTLAERSGQIVRIIDRLDTATQALGSGSGALEDALANLAETTDVLVLNRDRAVEALQELSRLAAVQNTVVVKHFDAVKTQIQQADAVLGTLANSQNDLRSLVDWLERFVLVVPDLIPRDFTIVYMEGVLRGSSDD